MDIILVWTMVMCTIQYSALQGAAQGQTYFAEQGDSNKVLNCVYRGANDIIDNYDKVEVFIGGPTIKLSEQNDGEADSTLFVSAGEQARYSVITDFRTLITNIIINPVAYRDHSSFICVYKDVSGGTNSADATTTIGLVVTAPGQIKLTNSLSNDETVADTGGTPPATPVVSGKLATFQCVVSAASPDAVISWEIDGTSVTDGDGGITVAQSTAPNAQSPLDDTTSDITFTPQLNSSAGVHASDNSVVKCISYQEYDTPSRTYDATSSQELDVLVLPELSFMYEGTEYPGDSTVDIVRGQTINIDAVVMGGRRKSTISFTPTITPLTSPSEGVESDDTNAVDTRLTDSSKRYSFVAAMGNQDDYLVFSAENSAVTLLGITPPSARINFNLLAGPDAKLSYTDPVSNGDESSVVIVDPSTCAKKIRIIEGESLTITCKSTESEPAAVIKIYQGDGGDLPGGDTLLATSTGVHVVSSPSLSGLFDTTIPYTFADPNFGDNGDVISCFSENNLNTATASACFEFLVKPATGGITSTGGSPDDASLGGPITTPQETTTETQTVTNGDTVAYTCDASGASPAAVIKWYLTTATISRIEIAATSTPDAIETNGLFASSSELSIPMTYNNHCGAKIECVITHDAGPNPYATYAVDLKVILPPTPGTRPAITSYMHTEQVDIIAGQPYTYTCTSEDLDGEPGIVWNLIDDANTLSTKEIDTDASASPEPDCALSSNTDSVDITANFGEHHEKRLQCVTTNSGGSASTFILLNVFVPPTAIDLYPGGVTGNDPPVLASSTKTGDTHTGDQGEDFIFTCVATNANPVANVFWDLESANLIDNEVPYLGDDQLYDTYSTLATRQYSASDCDDVLRCRSDHTETNNTPQRVDSTRIMVRVPPTSLKLELLEDGSGVAALIGTTDITADQVVDGETLTVIYGKIYRFTATTSQIEPDATFDWDHTDNSNDAVALDDLQDTPGDSIITCNPEEDSDTYTLSDIDYDAYNGKRLRVTADNDHTEGPVPQFVLFDVNVEVDTLKMEMIVTNADTNTAVDKDNNGTPNESADDFYSLTNGVEYHIDCLVREATPEPEINLLLGSTDLGVTPTSPEYTDVPEGAGVLRQNILTTGRDSVTVTADQCGDTLTCTASNDANALLGNGDQSIMAEVKVVDGPSNIDTTVVGTGATKTGSDVVLIDSTDDNVFTCTVSGADEEADIKFNRVTADNSTTMLNSWDGVEVRPNCVTEEDSESHTFPQVDFTTHQDTRVQCCAENSATAENPTDNPVQCDTVTIDVHKPPAEMKISVQDKNNGGYQEYDDGDTIDVVEGLTDIKCEATESNPAVTVTWTIDGAAKTEDNNAETGPTDGLYGYTSFVEDYDLQKCVTVVCMASNDAITALGQVATWTRTIHLRPRFGPSAPTLILNEDGDNNIDQDGIPNDENAILIEGKDYEFKCTAAADTADPEAHVEWKLFSQGAADPVVEELDSSTENLPNCVRSENDEYFSLNAARVTYADLQCGYLVCRVYNDVDPTGEEARITFQIWKPPTSIAGQGGTGIQLDYAVEGSNDWKSLAHEDTVNLDVETYDFRCTVPGINPPSLNDATAKNSLSPALGVCGAPGSPGSSVAKDILNIAFYYGSEPRDDGESGDDPETATEDGGLYNMSDIYKREINADDSCPVVLTCRADIFFEGSATPSATDEPFISVSIRRVSPTTAVKITTPTFDEGVIGVVTKESSPGDAGGLALYEGDTYTLACTSTGADPDEAIHWWLTDTCSDDDDAGVRIGPAFEPTMLEADCDHQPDGDDDENEWDSFVPVFEDHNNKCLRCISGGLIDQYLLDIRKAPSRVTLYDGPTDDDNDGDSGEDDQLGSRVTLCSEKAFDFMAIAFGANPAVDPLTITLDGDPVADDTPDVGIVVENIKSTNASIDGAGLFDSVATVAFPANSFTLADNGDEIRVCDVDSSVCDSFLLNVVVSPEPELELLVTDPFASNRTGDTMRKLTNGLDPLRLHLAESYVFTCTAKNAHPYAGLTFSHYPESASPTVPNPNPEDSGLTTLYESTSTLMFTPNNFDHNGDAFCCRGANSATELGCNTQRVEICVKLEIVDEPAAVTMRYQGVAVGGKFEDIIVDENGNSYTDLRANANFGFECVAHESYPKAEIIWDYIPTEEYPDFDPLAADRDPDVAIDSLTSSINGLVDTVGKITIEAVKDILGGTLKCCARHVAVPDGVDEIDENPKLKPICTQTVLRFPVAPTNVQIWEQIADSPFVYNKGDTLKANVGEERKIECTSFQSRPVTYIGWSADNPLAIGAPARESSFVTSDCPFTFVESDVVDKNPLTLTYDTTKCAILQPTIEYHKIKLTCTATNVADLAGDATATYVYLDLCIPCSVNLQLLDIRDDGSLPTSGYDNGDVVSFKATGEPRRLSCINTGAREKPDVDVFIRPYGSSELIFVDSTYTVYSERNLEDFNEGSAYEGLWEVRKDVTLSAQFHIDINGAELICKCTNGIYNGDSEHIITVTLAVFDQLPQDNSVFVGFGKAGIESPEAGEIDNVVSGVNSVLKANGVFSADQPDPFAPPNFPPASNILDISNGKRRKRQASTNDYKLTCYALGTKPAVDFIWKLDGQVLDGNFINQYTRDSVRNVGPGQGLLDTYSIITLDPVYRGYHSRQLCCEISSGVIGSPIERCTKLAVLSAPNSPLEVSGTSVVNEGATVQLQCKAVDHYKEGTFQWDDDDGNTLLSDEAQSNSQLQVLPNFRYQQQSQYSFTATREDNGKNLVCKFEQHYDKDGVTFDATTRGNIDIAVNFCPVTNAEINGCPTAPVSPNRAVTVSCQSAVSNPALRLDWYMNNVAQTSSSLPSTQARDYGFVSNQAFTTRQLGLVDNGLQLQCCPIHLTASIGCGQLCSSVCTIRVEQPPPEVGCRWVRVEVTLENLDTDRAIWQPDYANTLSATYRNLVNGLTDVFRQVYDGLQDYKSATIPTIRESGDGLVLVVIGLEFNSPYGSTTDHIDQVLIDATNGDGYIVTDGGARSSYDILPNSANAVCVCPTGYCARGPSCVPSPDDFSSSCICPVNYPPPRCDVYVAPGEGTLPPPTTGVVIGRLVFVLKEINNIPAIWSSKYDDVGESETQTIINGLDTTLTGIFSPAFSCFRNVRIAQLFAAAGGGIGVVSGVELTHNCGITLDNIKQKFLENVDDDQVIGNSIYELDSDFLSETTIEEVCGSGFSCVNGGQCVPSDKVYYSSCNCPSGYGGSRCQDLIRVLTTKPVDPTTKPKGGLSTEALIGIIIGVVLFVAILIGLLLLCCFLCGDRERVRTRVVYTDEDEPPRRGYGTPPRQALIAQPQQKMRNAAYDDWPWSSDGRPPVAYNKDTFDLNFDQRGGARMGPRPLL